MTPALPGGGGPFSAAPRAAPGGALDTWRFRLTALTVLFFLGWKLWGLDGQPLAVLFATWAFEAVALCWVFATCALLDLVPPLKKARVPTVLFGIGYLFQYVMGFFTVYFFADTLVRKYSLLDMGPDAVAYLLREVAPKRGVALCVGVLVALCALAHGTGRVRLRLRGAPAFAGLVAASAIAVLVAPKTPQFASPLWDLALDLDEVRRHPPIAASEGARHAPELLDKAAPGKVQLETRFKRVVVFVMESVTKQHFDASLRDGDFFRRTAEHQHVYSDFFTNDMDSRTGMLALLTSRFVPYEAYRDPDLERYRLLGKKPSLVDVMRDNGYHTVISTAQVMSESIVRDLAWHENLVLTEAETKALAKDHLCFNPYKFEDSCEDRVMLPQLFERLRKHEKLFWVQQLVWGHLPDYSAKTGKSDVQSYGEMIDGLVAYLEQQGQLDDTLIVVTSDHGVRERNTETLVTTYRIPLLFYARGFERKESAALYSQIDFKDLLSSELAEQGQQVPAASLAMFVGPTYTSIIGAVTDAHDFMVIKNRPFARYVLAHQSHDGGAPKGNVSPHQVLELFEDYRRYFQSPGFR